LSAPQTFGTEVVQKVGQMKTTPEHDARIAKMTFASVYPHYISKVEINGRTKDELNKVIEWLTRCHLKKSQPSPISKHYGQ
jgi:hypothetical protein